MCFRPGGAVKAQNCPNCGKKLVPIGGVIQKKCPFCKTDLTQYADKQEPPKA